MSLESKHPSYLNNQEDWVLMRDAYEGERTVKRKGTTYLPATSSMVKQGLETGKPGDLRYQAYLLRAVFHDIVEPSVQAMLGSMHRRPAQIQLPAKLEGMRTRATFSGEDLHTLILRTNEQQLITGRVGLLLDVPTGIRPGEGLPYVATYNTENIFNWDTTRPTEGGELKLKFVVLNEAGVERARRTLESPNIRLVSRTLEWLDRRTYRVLADGDYMQDVWEGMPTGYNAGTSQDDKPEIAMTEFIRPEFGGTTLPEIPFVCIGSRDLVPEPDKPPLLTLARLSMAIYRTEADYREALFKQGQSTLVLVGAVNQYGEDTVELGAGSTIELPIGGSATFATAGHEGLGPMAEAINADEKRAAQAGANLLDQQGNVQESGQALNTRSAARTVSLTTVANCGTAGVERVLKTAAIWVGADPDEVKIEPNKDFGDVDALAADLVSLMAAKNAGAPISKKSVHGWMKDNGFTKMTFDEEEQELAGEPPPMLGTPGSAGGPGSLLANQQKGGGAARRTRSQQQPPKASKPKL